MKNFNKWLDKNESAINNCNPVLAAEISWNAAANTILTTIKRRNKEFEGNWQHEDIELLIDDIKEIIK